MQAKPDVLNHNIETVPRLYRQVRLGARYERSLEMLAYAKSLQPNIPTKSGLMMGLGETMDEVRQVMRDLRAHNVDILTLGQYLRPSPKHLPIIRYVPVDDFNELKRAGFEMGFEHVEAGPLVRSSYHADEAVSALPASHSQSVPPPPLPGLSYLSSPNRTSSKQGSTGSPPKTAIDGPRSRPCSAKSAAMATG
jgi:lipoate synthase